MKDISLGASAIQILQQLVGKQFVRYSFASFLAPDAFEVAGLYIGGETYKISSDLEAVQRFFHDDDVAVMRIAPCQPGEIINMVKDGQMIDTPVQDTIVSIDVVNDRESVAHDGEQKELLSTKGIIFHLASGNEISFEIGTWFSEMITIRRDICLI